MNFQDKRERGEKWLFVILGIEIPIRSPPNIYIWKEVDCLEGN